MNNYFYGWYFRCQDKSGTVAVIPSVHLSSKKRYCSIQVLTQNESLYQEFPISCFQINKKRGIMQIGENLFTQKGIRLNFEGIALEANQSNHTTKCATSDNKRVVVRGNLHFGKFAEPKYNIMGLFAYIPGMQCKHAVYSMRHTVNGYLTLNGKNITFKNGIGYMEGDSGTSFPDKYIWTQHFLPKGSIMFAAASIPLAGIHFKGTLGFIFNDNKEYRFATYLGALVTRMSDRELLVRQGRYKLHVRFLEPGGSALKAPDSGIMTRRVQENIACKVEYTLLRGKKVLLHIVTDKAAAEYDVKENNN